nr:nickel insertion protein [[Clostridium] methoxybenzovorans]
MKTIYFDCSMGVAGDMLMSALLELSPNPQIFINKINYLGIPGISVKAKKQFGMEWQAHI